MSITVCPNCGQSFTVCPNCGQSFTVIKDLVREVEDLKCTRWKAFTNEELRAINDGMYPKNSKLAEEIFTEILIRMR